MELTDDFLLGAEYEGPCPPNNYTPYVHDYVITVYALDTCLNLPDGSNGSRKPDPLSRHKFP